MNPSPSIFIGGLFSGMAVDAYALLPYLYGWLTYSGVGQRLLSRSQSAKN
jgi:hypothetical protein